MSVLVDSYSESNQNTQLWMNTIQDRNAVGQSFTGNGTILNSAKFYLKKSGSPTGSVYAKIYAQTGTYGDRYSDKPTGLELSVSDAVDITTVGTNWSLITFIFTGENKIELENGVHYCTECYWGLDGETNALAVGRDDSSPSHSGSGNMYDISEGVWYVSASADTCFYVYGDSPIIGVKYPLPAFKRP